MQTFSLYRYENQNLKNALNVLRDFQTWHTKEIDPITEEELDFNISLSEVYQAHINNTEMNYIHIDFKSEKLSIKHKFNKDKDKRIRKNECKIIVFEDQNDLILIPLRGKNPTTLSILRTIFNEEEPQSIINHDLNLTEDLFYWIFDKYINDYKTTELKKGSNIHIDSLTGYSGETRDELNKISGNGNRITEILWTLAFLFNNESLKSIRPDIRKLNENVRIELTLSGTHKIDENSNNGLMLLEPDENKKIGYLICFFYFDLLPNIISIYEKDYEDGIWSPQIKLHFLRSLGSDIQGQVQNKMNAIEAELREKEEVEEVEETDEII